MTASDSPPGIGASRANSEPRALTDEQRTTITNAEDDAVWHAGCDALAVMDAQSARLQKLEREYAVAILETLSREGRAPKVVDHAVAILARDYAHLPIGDCESCGARAPLTGGDGSERGTSVCAWGCAP